MKLYFQDFQTPLGEMCAVATQDALVMLSFKDSKDYPTTIQKLKKHGSLTRVSHHPIIAQIASELTAYFYGECSMFKTPIRYLTGTSFQQSVWEALQQLKIGSTVNYSHIAHMIERPQSTRAVATAIGHNPLSIIVPCHRVIRKDGHLGGFNSGLYRKKQLLNHEARIKTTLS